MNNFGFNSLRHQEVWLMQLYCCCQLHISGSLLFLFIF